MRLTDHATPPPSYRLSRAHTHSFGRVARSLPVTPRRLAGGAAAAPADRAGATDRPLALQLHAAARADRARRLGDVIARALRPVVDAARRVAAQWRYRRAMRATYIALSGLDAATLRDLGFHRSELPSIAWRTARLAATAPSVALRGIDLKTFNQQT